MSNSSRAWLLQIPNRDSRILLGLITDTLRKTGYFNRFYVADTMYTVGLKDIEQIELKRDYGWSNNIIKALEYVGEDVFFMGCEDHLLVDFDEGWVEYAYTVVELGEFGCVRLTTKPQIKTRGKYGNVKAIDRSYKYYVSLQPTVWNKEYLKKIIRPDESAWQFEVLASQRAKELDSPAGVTYKTAFNYKNLIEKGKLVDDPKDYVSIHGE